MEARRVEEAKKFDDWFSEFDRNNDRHLDKSELAALLMTIQPDCPPADSTLDRLMEEAKLIGTGEPVQRSQLRAILLKNLAYVKEAQFLDNVFERFDQDGSGSLDRDELKGMMFSVSSGDVRVFPSGDPAQAQAACIAYKLKCLEDLRKKGIIDEQVVKEKRLRIFKRHHNLMSPRLREHDPQPEEIDFVLDQVDQNKDNKISKDECLAALGIWMQVMKDDPVAVHTKEEKSHTCVIA